MQKNIVVRGAKMHNLKNITVEIPRDKLVVVTGVSGSGKSTLAFDTIYAEGQRRYVESLSAYARQFLNLTEKPDVESIDGLSPAISIDQKSTSKNPRSTVGTVTEIYDHLRLLFAKVGHPHCPSCGTQIQRQSMAEIIEKISELEDGKRILILAPVVRDINGSHDQIISQVKAEGFVRVRVNGEIRTLNESIILDPAVKHSIEIVVDRLVKKDYSPKYKELSDGTRIDQPNPDRTRLADSLEIALKQANGFISVMDNDTGEMMKFSERYSCPSHPNLEMPEIEPRSFSFNSPHGACPDCHGMGKKRIAQEDLIIPNKDLSLEEGALHPWADSKFHMGLLKAVASKYEIPMNTPVKKLKRKHIDMFLWGTGNEEFSTEMASGKVQGTFTTKFEGAIPHVERKYLETDSEHTKKHLERYMKSAVCPECNGEKLRKEVLGVTVGGKNIIQMTHLSIDECYTFFKKLSLELSDSENMIVRVLIEEVESRLHFLIDVGLPYLSLDRGANTLSGGEAQRIRLATQIGSALQGVLYVLDEPSIGLHQRDNAKLIETMKGLRDIGNTVLVVEHDEDTMMIADHIIEIGPEAGRGGGQVVAEGTVEDIMNCKTSPTGNFLSGRECIEIPKERRKGNGNYLEILGARAHNLKNVNVKIPLGMLIGVSGVSGSGKSSLINGILGTELARQLNKAESRGLDHDNILGVEHLDKIIHIDQSPIGRTPRSNCATYTGVFTDIRELFASQPDAKLRGYNSGRFSFNVKGGRCETCAGDGVKKIEMHFLPDVYVPCDVCHGKRYNQEALEIKWRGKNISDVLGMTVSESLDFFESIPNIKVKLKTLFDVGLSYVQLGQSATTLSGGEAQRVKLATELSKRATGKTIYILDEPTTGLHFQDIKKLLEVLNRLVEKGNSVLLIEHNLDVIKTCDHVIDIGPNGGNGGGELVAEGTPEEIVKVKKSYTGHFLKKLLKK